MSDVSNNLNIGDKILVWCPHIKEIHGKIKKVFDIEGKCVIIKDRLGEQKVLYVLSRRNIRPISKKSR